MESFKLDPRPQGTGNCSRVSCSHDSGIDACNDNPYEVWLYYETIADYSAIINDQCKEQNEVLGDAYGPGGWHVIIGMEAAGSLPGL